MADVDRIRIGTCGWTDPTLIKAGTFYPPGTNTAEERLRYYASQFPIVEVDSTYYALPRQDQAGLWVERTPPDFNFNVKAYALLTQHPTQAKALPKDLREAILPEHRDKQRIYPNHLPPDAMDEVWHRFHEALLPLDSAAKLGAILLQFPEWFVPNMENRAYLESLHDKLPGYRLAIEFRNKMWMESERDQHRTLGFLRANELTYVNLDMPQGFKSSLPATAEVTDPKLALVRFHGRDPEAWTKKTVQERFRYLYKSAELQEWVPRVERLAENAEQVQALMNNCYSDHAVVGARQLAALLQGVDTKAAVQAHAEPAG
jgi:uncharacterized protein YecE (DUF72 family)